MLGRQDSESRRGGRRRRDGLVQHHVEAGAQGRRRVVDVRDIGRADDGQVVPPGPCLLRGVVDDGIGVGRARLGLPVGVPRDDRVEGQAGGGRDQRTVEDAAAEAVPEEDDGQG